MPQQEGHVLRCEGQSKHFVVLALPLPQLLGASEVSFSGANEPLSPGAEEGNIWDPLAESI